MRLLHLPALPSPPPFLLYTCLEPWLTLLTTSQTPPNLEKTNGLSDGLYHGPADLLTFPFFLLFGSHFSLSRQMGRM